MMKELANREKGEPLPPEVGKKFKDLKNVLLKVSTFVPDPEPKLTNRRSRRFLSKLEKQS